MQIVLCNYCADIHADTAGIPCIVPSTVPEKCSVMQNSTMQGLYLFTNGSIDEKWYNVRFLLVKGT